MPLREDTNVRLLQLLTPFLLKADVHMLAITWVPISMLPILNWVWRFLLPLGCYATANTGRAAGLGCRLYLGLLIAIVQHTINVTLFTIKDYS